MAVVSLKYKSKQGTLTAPGDVDPGAMIPIATTTLSTATSTITFSNIPQSYEHLQIRSISQSNYTAYNLNLFMRFNSDSNSNYNFHYLFGDGGGVYVTSDSRTAIYLSSAVPGTYYSSAWGKSIIDILDYTNTNKYTTTRSLAGFDSNGGGLVGLFSGLWRNTAAINEITLTLSVGDFTQYSSFALYGIKRAGA